MRRALRRAPPLGPDLRAMVWPLAPEAFLRDYFQSRHFVSHGPAARLKPLMDALRLRTVEDYLARRQEPVQVWYQTREGDYAVADTAAKDALGLYRAGLTVYINQVRELSRWKARLGRQLGFEMMGAPSLFGARRGGGTRWHFDWLENFTVQLQGTKRRRVAPNPQAPLPLENWVTRQRMSDALRLYVPDALPREAPPGPAETVELRPGSLLYLPRGHWHTAEASSGDSLSVTFLYGSTTWGALLAPALRDLLTSGARWREHAAELFGDRRDDRRAREKAAAYLSELRAAVGRLRPEDLVPRPRPRVRLGPGSRLRRNPLAFLHVGFPGAGGTRTVAFQLQALRPEHFDLDLEPGLAPVCLYVARQQGSFLASEAAASAPRVPPARAFGLLRVLLKAGVVQQD